jgi:hypothetical protein
MNQNALFQSDNRHEHYPGNNLYFTISRSSLHDETGLRQNASIHSDVIASVDNRGNFPATNLIQDIFASRDNIQTSFNNYLELDPPVIINPNSFLNRRLQSGLSDTKPDEIKLKKRIMSRPTILSKPNKIFEEDED